MKNIKCELSRRLQHQHYKNHPWDLSRGGLYIPHSYKEKSPNGLSWWDDVGFNLNGRYVMVWWVHPRMEYADAIEDMARKEAGDNLQDNWLIDGGTKNYRSVGASRKKVMSYTSSFPSAVQKQYYDNLSGISTRLKADGIDFEVSTSFRRERLCWATGVSLVAPLEVRNETELAAVAHLARRLVLGQTTLEIEFPRYSYTRADWLREQKEKSA